MAENKKLDLSGFDEELEKELDLSAFDSEVELEPIDLGATEPKEVEAPGMLESGGRGLLQGASLGFADEISGALESAFTDKTYEQARDESRANFKAAQEANPMTYGAGELGGGVASLLVPGLGAAKVAKGASLGSKLLMGAKTGAKLGGLYGAGSSEADLTKGEIGDFAKDTAVSATAGGLLSTAMPTLFSGASLGKGVGLADSLKKAATAGGAGAAIGLGLDAASPEENDFTQSAMLGAAGGLGLRGLSRLGAGLTKFITPGRKADIKLAHDMGTRGEKLADPEAFKRKSLAFNKLVSDKTDDIAVSNKRLMDNVNANKQLILDERALASKQGQDKLKVLIEQADDVVEATKKDIGRVYEEVADQVKDVKFTPARKLEDFIKVVNDDVAFTNMDDVVKGRIIDKLRTNAYTGESNIAEVNQLRKLVSSYANLYKKEPQIASKFNSLYAELNDDIANTLAASGREDVAGLLSTANKQYSSLLNVQKELINKSPEARATLLKKLGEEVKAGQRVTADKMKALAGKADTPAGKLTSYMDDVERTTKDLARADARVSPEDLKRQVLPKLNANDLKLNEALEGLEDVAGKLNAKNRISGELKPEAVRNFKNKVTQIIVDAGEEFNTPGKSADYNRLEKAVKQVMGEDEGAKFLNNARTQADELSLMAKASKDNAYEGSPISQSAIARETLGTLSRLEKQVANYIGRLKAGDTKGFVNGVVKDESVLAGMANRARQKGNTGIANALDKMKTKDIAGRNALMFTLLQNPGYRSQLQDLSDEKE